MTAPTATPGALDGPIARPTLHAQVVGRVRDLIIEGRLAPGERIHEGRLCQVLGVSRTPLREALKVLASEGLIEILPSRGAVVRTFTPKEIKDTLLVMGHLEALAASLTCRLASDDDIRAVRAVHDRMMARYAARNRLEYFKLNQVIHGTIVRLSGNETLRAIHETLQARLKRIRYVGNDGAEEWRSAVDEHEEMIAALEARDAERLGAVLRRHMDGTWTRVSAALHLQEP